MGLFMLGSPPQQRLVYTGPASQLCTTVAPAAQPKTARTRGSPKKRRKHKTTQTQKGRQATISLVSKGSKRALLQFITVMYMYGK